MVAKNRLNPGSEPGWCLVLRTSPRILQQREADAIEWIHTEEAGKYTVRRKGHCRGERGRRDRKGVASARVPAAGTASRISQTSDSAGPGHPCVDKL